MKRKGNLSLLSQKPKPPKRSKKIHVNEANGAGKKDRHSKVCTAGGIRDRRVRLSPKTAIQFYDVQNKLGYDRPSRAIDWLMEEAKAAIDALDEPPSISAVNTRFVPANFTKISNCDPRDGITQLNQRENTVSLTEGNFGFRTNSTTGHSTAVCLECFSPAPLTIHDDPFDSNSDMAKMQRIFTWNYGSYSPPHHFPGPSILGEAQMFSQREPLQSSYSRIENYNPLSQFPGFDFSSEELTGFTTTPEENAMSNQVSGELSSTAFFLHYEE